MKKGGLFIVILFSLVLSPNNHVNCDDGDDETTTAGKKNAPAGAPPPEGETDYDYGDLDDDRFDDEGSYGRQDCTSDEEADDCSEACDRHGECRRASHNVSPSFLFVD